MSQTIVFDLFGVILRPQASCRIGITKPDLRAYAICARRMGVDPADMLFFDDRESNVVAAREAGLTAEVFASPDQVRALVARS